MGAIGLIFLQAAGILLLLWGLCGWLVSGRDRGGAAVLWCGPGRDGEPFVRCCLWLRGAGLLTAPVVLVDDGLDGEGRSRLERLARGRTDVFLCTPAELPGILKTEAEKLGGAGTAARDCGGGDLPKQ